MTGTADPMEANEAHIPITETKHMKWFLAGEPIMWYSVAFYYQFGKRFAAVLVIVATDD